MVTRSAPENVPTHWRSVGVLAAVAMIALIAVWPVPTIVGAMVASGLWLLADTERTRLARHRHHRADLRVARREALAVVALGAATGLAARAWPLQLAAGALIFLAGAAFVSTSSGVSGRPPRGDTHNDSGRAASLAFVTVPSSEQPRRSRRGRIPR
jgi:hypothetical protein